MAHMLVSTRGFALFTQQIFQIPPFPTTVADVSSQFFYFKAMKHDRFGRALDGDTKSYFKCTKEWSRRTRQALRSIRSNFKYSYQPENATKNFVS